MDVEKIKNAASILILLGIVGVIAYGLGWRVTTTSKTTATNNS